MIPSLGWGRACPGQQRQSLILLDPVEKGGFLLLLLSSSCTALVSGGEVGTVPRTRVTVWVFPVAQQVPALGPGAQLPLLPPPLHPGTWAGGAGGGPGSHSKTPPHAAVCSRFAPLHLLQGRATVGSLEATELYLPSCFGPLSVKPNPLSRDYCLYQFVKKKIVDRALGFEPPED